HTHGTFTQIPHEVVRDLDVGDVAAAAGHRNGGAALPRTRAGALADVVEGVSIDENVVHVLIQAELDLLPRSVSENVVPYVDVEGRAVVTGTAEVDEMLIRTVGRRAGLKLAVNNTEIIDNPPLRDVFPHTRHSPLRPVER